MSLRVSLVYLFVGLFSWKLRNDSVVTDEKIMPSATQCHLPLSVISSSDAHFPSGVFSDLTCGWEKKLLYFAITRIFRVLWKADFDAEVNQEREGAIQTAGKRKNTEKMWLLHSALPLTTWKAFRFPNTPRSPRCKGIWPGQRGRWMYCGLTQTAEARTPRRLGSWPSFWAFKGGTREIAFSRHNVWPWRSQFTFLNFSSLSCKEWME